MADGLTALLRPQNCSAARTQFPAENSLEGFPCNYDAESQISLPNWLATLLLLTKLREEGGLVCEGHSGWQSFWLCSQTFPA